MKRRATNRAISHVDTLKRAGLLLVLAVLGASHGFAQANCTRSLSGTGAYDDSAYSETSKSCEWVGVPRVEPTVALLVWTRETIEDSTRIQIEV